MDTLVLPPVLGVFGLIAAFVIYGIVKKYPAGEGAVTEIADAIHEGALVFMRREYTILFGFVVVLVILLFWGFQSWHTPTAFIVGALSSALAGYIGMYTATQANVRTTVAASEKGQA
ncbi:MAG: sodium/proton-translocating pyrophosphatase, partial [Pseudomonadota bacterium]